MTAADRKKKRTKSTLTCVVLFPFLHPSRIIACNLRPLGLAYEGEPSNKKLLHIHPLICPSFTSDFDRFFDQSLYIYVGEVGGVGFSSLFRSIKIRVCICPLSLTWGRRPPNGSVPYTSSHDTHHHTVRDRDRKAISDTIPRSYFL